MSFFFQDQQKKQVTVKKAGPRVAGPTNKMKQSTATLNRLGCRVCPLNDTSKQIDPKLPKKTEVLFLGEAPTGKSAKGVPFTNKYEKILKSLIPEGKLKTTGFAYITKHKPLSGFTADWQAIECCRGHVTADIENARPRLIVGLDKAVCNQVLGSNDIFGLRGRIFAVKIGKHSCWFMPAFGPRDVVNQAFDKNKPLQHRLGLCLKLDVEKAYEYASKKKIPTILSPVDAKADINCYTGSKANDFDKLIAEFAEAEKAKVLATDLETYKLRSYSDGAQILTASVAYRVKKKIKTFAFALHHPKAGWTNTQIKKIFAAYKRLLAKPKIRKVAHNTPFDLEWLYESFGRDIIKHKLWDDTMMQAHLIDERKGPGKEEDRRPTYQSLDFLTKQHFGLAVKSLFKLNKKDMRKTDINDCLLYNGTDSKVTLLLFEHQKELLIEMGLWDTYEFIHSRIAATAVMQSMGIPVDQEVNKKLGDKLGSEIKDIEAEIEGLKVVKKYIKDKGEFNPHSSDQVLAVFRDYLNRDEVKVLKAQPKSENDYRESVDKAVLEQIDHPLAPAIIKLRNKQKLKSTYIDGLTLPHGEDIYPDGMIHSSFNLTFAETGRLSSDGPNLQNFPKRYDAWVREQVQPKKGEVLLSIDYGQLEWVLACVCTRDKVMVDATWNRYDVHMEWAKKIAKIWPKLVGGKKYLDDPAKMKFARGLVKNKMVFPVIFGAQESSVAGYLNMPEDVSKVIFKEFWDTFQGLEKWQKQTMRGYYENGYVENLFGRRRNYPLSRNAAINHPIQSTASDIVVEAMTRLSKLAFETGEMYLHPRMNIHDDLTFILPKDNEDFVDDAIATIITEMLKLPFDFMNVPMAAEVAIGKNWFEMEEIGKFWSDQI